MGDFSKYLIISVTRVPTNQNKYKPRFWSKGPETFTELVVNISVSEL